MTDQEIRKQEVERVINEFDGPPKVAKLFSISRQAVSKWKRRGIPDSRLMYLKLLKPQVFEKS